ncbi:MAG: nuclear transport factor 2 family protein [Bacteroidota bacterium]
MSNLFEKIADLNDLVLQGKTMDAFEKYYADEVVMQENEEEPTIGKDANRKREEEFLKNLAEFRNAKLLKVAIGKNTTMVEWYYDFTHLEWGVRNYSQVSVQEWEDGKIVREKFYYNR